MDTTLKKIDALFRHIEGVQSNCRILGERLIELGRTDLGVQLIRNALIHDQSKFSGIEWDNLSNEVETAESKLLLQEAISHHNRTNPHHPEFWGGIKNMPPVYIAEMVCDWKARSSEFGTSLQEWIDESATVRFAFTKRDKIYKDIKAFLSLLLEKPFKPVT